MAVRNVVTNAINKEISEILKSHGVSERDIADVEHELKTRILSLAVLQGVIDDPDNIYSPWLDSFAEKHGCKFGVCE